MDRPLVPARPTPHSSLQREESGPFSLTTRRNARRPKPCLDMFLEFIELVRRMALRESTDSGWYVIDASIRLTNSGAKSYEPLRARCSQAAKVPGLHPLSRRNPVQGEFLHHAVRSKVAGEKNQRPLEADHVVVAKAQTGFVQDSQQQFLECGRSLFDFIEQHNGKAAPFTRDGSQLCLCKERVRLPMAQVAGRRANKLRHLMIHLVFAAIYTQKMLTRAVKHLSQRFNRASLAGSSRSQQKEHTRRAAFRRKPRGIHVNVRHNRRKRLGLPDDFRLEPV